MKSSDIFIQLSQKTQNFEDRPQQRDIVKRIESCFADGKHSVIQAPPGTGKSIAYLIPAILWIIETGGKVAISTYSKVLQRQLMYKDMPMMKKLFGSMSYALCLGGQNYFCMQKLQLVDELDMFSPHNEEKQWFGQLWQHFKDNKSNSLLNFGFDLPHEILRKIMCDKATCNSACPYQSSCTYFSDIKNQADASILITNHHYTLSHLKTGSKLFAGVGIIIFDECHELEDVATDIFSQTVDSAGIKSMAEEISFACVRKKALSGLHIQEDLKDSLTGIGRSLKSAVNIIHESLSESKDKIISNDDIESIQEMQMPLSHLKGALAELKTDYFAGRQTQLTDIISCIDNICSTQKKDNRISVKHVTQKEWKLSIAPISVANILRKKLFTTKKITAHISATIFINKNMTFYTGRIGLDECDKMITNSPFDFEKQAMLYIPQNMPEPTERDYINSVCNEIGKLLDYFKGRTLVLFTNNDVMKATYDAITPRFPNLHFLMQGMVSGRDLTEEFKKLPNAVLFGSRSFWEGVDIQGDALQCVILTKFPFPFHEDPIIAARMKALGKQGFYKYLLPKAQISFLQGFGRLIRTKKDKGVVAILDARINNKSYGKTFKNALPKCKIIDNVDCLDDFFSRDANAS